MFYPYDVQCRLRDSPQKYLGDETLSAYEAFVFGYQLIPTNDLVWLDFDTWVREHAQMHPGVYNALSVLRLTCANDRDALHVFFKEFDDCLAADKYARDARRWPHPPPIRPHVPSKRTYLDNMKHHRGFFFGGRSISLLWAFFAGHDRSITDLGQDPDPLNMGDFERWLGKRMGFRHAYRWDRVLEFLSMGSHSKEFSLFFELMHEYLEEKGDPWIEAPE